MEINYQLLSIKNVQALTLRALSDTVRAILSVKISPLVILNRTNHTVLLKYMFRILTFLVLLSANLHATDKIQTVLVTIPVLHTSDEGGVKFARIPYTGWDIDNPYISCAYYSIPIVAFENSKHHRQDINLISAYKITVDSNLDQGITHITIRTHKAKKPEGFKLTVGGVVELTAKALKEDFPNEKRYVIEVSDKPFKPTIAEQGGAEQPATAPQLKSEDHEKPKPEPDVRPQ